MSEMSAAEFGRQVDVSRETLVRMQAYAEMLRRWNPKINLVAKSTLPSLWSRHFLDSAQLLALAPVGAQTWADLGSGGGFPGLVVAIMAAEKRPGLAVSLVESDGRKAAFLRNVLREVGLRAEVHVARAETLAPLRADIVSGRALAALAELLPLAHRHMTSRGAAIFPKGVKAKEEIATARKTWQFELESVPSITDPNASILRIGGLSRV